jgi:hypothetical protein
MTDTEIMALAEKFAAHRDVREIELRGGAILEFVRAYNEACMRKWLESLPPKVPESVSFKGNTLEEKRTAMDWTPW